MSLAGRKVTFLDDDILALADGSTAFSLVTIQIAGEDNYIYLANHKSHKSIDECFETFMCTTYIDSDSKGILLLKRSLYCLDPIQYLLYEGIIQTLPYPSMATVAQTSLGANISVIALVVFLQMQ